MNLTYKLLYNHLKEGNLVPNTEIGIVIDQTLTQDSTGTMAYLQFEAMNIDRVKTEKSIAYIDHNTLQTGFENADDHLYISTVTKKHGIYLSKPGNGICHQVHLERIGKPGKTLLGSDSHTPTCGALGMIAIGAGGLDVAVAMGGGLYYLSCPKVTEVYLTGELKPYVAAKDVILELLRILSVKGGVGQVFEYTGPGLSKLSIPERATIANMGAELGATTSVFPSDEITYEFLLAQNRAEDFIKLHADDNAIYDNRIEIDLSSLEPMVAMPHMPDNVVKVKEIENLKVDQVCIGSCTNSSYLDLMKVAKILKGKTVNPDVSLVISPGSKQVLSMLAGNGALQDIINSGARILESACGPCIGMGQSPSTNAVSVRTNNRNFYSRSGTKSAGVYLTSCETAAATALTGYLTDPRELNVDIDIEMPKTFLINDNLIIPPANSDTSKEIEVVRGPNIKPFPSSEKLPNSFESNILLKMDDNITTDHIMPSNAQLLPYRSNIPKLSEYCLNPVDPTFPSRAVAAGGGILVAGQNYGQGSSREHAALVPLYLKIKAIIAKSFARIHRNNLINNGILPLLFVNEDDYNILKQGNTIEFENIREALLNNNSVISVNVKELNKSINLELNVSERERNMLLDGGLINLIKNNK